MWIQDEFRKAEMDCRKAIWFYLPEGIFDKIDEEGYEVSKDDIDFLEVTALIPESSASVAAIRLLGILAEEGLVAIEPLLPLILSLLKSTDPSHRYYAVEAIWQAELYKCVPALWELLKKESMSDIVKLATRAIDVLQRLERRKMDDDD